jgi:hypothetical protein
MAFEKNDRCPRLTRKKDKTLFYLTLKYLVAHATLFDFVFLQIVIETSKFIFCNFAWGLRCGCEVVWRLACFGAALT